MDCMKEKSDLVQKQLQNQRTASTDIQQIASESMQQNFSDMLSTLTDMFKVSKDSA